jgi:hypothetical protein
MKLTKKNKEHIDSLGYESLLRHSRFAPVGDHWFQGETGDYWLKRMGELKDQDPAGAVAASKNIGFD